MTNTNIESISTDKSLLLLKQHVTGKGFSLKYYQSPLNFTFAEKISALSTHWLHFPLGKSIHATQDTDDLPPESFTKCGLCPIISKGDLAFVPAGQPTYWRARVDDRPLSFLCIYFQPELVMATAAGSGLDLALPNQLDLVHCLTQSDPHLHQIAMMLLAELKSGGIMGELYLESLTQVLTIHLLQHYGNSQQMLVEPMLGTRHANGTIIADRHSRNQTRLQQAIDYIHDNLNGDLSMTQIASSINISPTYFASLFKQATGISLHQYVITQRVERAKLLLTKNADLSIESIAEQVGFSSQSHLIYHCKRLTGMTPKQFINSKIVRF
jgi:AraC family transcriptional regulator